MEFFGVLCRKPDPQISFFLYPEQSDFFLSYEVCPQQPQYSPLHSLKLSSVLDTRPVTYGLRNLKDVDILGSFYEYELQS